MDEKCHMSFYRISFKISDVRVSMFDLSYDLCVHREMNL